MSGSPARRIVRPWRWRAACGGDPSPAATSQRCVVGRPRRHTGHSVALLCLSLVCPLAFAGLSSGAADGYCLAPFNSQVGFVASRGFMELYTNDFDVYAQVGNTLSATRLHLLCNAAACRRSLSLGSASLTPIRGWRVPAQYDVLFARPCVQYQRGQPRESACAHTPLPPSPGRLDGWLAVCRHERCWQDKARLSEPS